MTPKQKYIIIPYALYIIITIIVLCCDLKTNLAVGFLLLLWVTGVLVHTYGLLTDFTQQGINRATKIGLCCGVAGCFLIAIIGLILDWPTGLAMLFGALIGAVIPPIKKGVQEAKADRLSRQQQGQAQAQP